MNKEQVEFVCTKTKLKCIDIIIGIIGMIRFPLPRIKRPIWLISPSKIFHSPLHYLYVYVLQFDISL